MKTTMHTQERLLREAIRTILAEDSSFMPVSRMRKIRYNLSEDYVVNVLGFDRMMLTERASIDLMESVILREHLLFEGFWGSIKDKIVDMVKDNPITNTIDAAKRFGNGVNGVAAALTGVVNSGGDAIDTVVAGARGLASKARLFIAKALVKLVRRIKELVSKLGDKAKAKAEPVIQKMMSFISTFEDKVEQLTSGGGWKGMMGAIGTFLALAAVREKIVNLVGSALKILSGNAKQMMSGALSLKSQVDSALEGDEEEEEENAEEKPEDEEDVITAAIQTMLSALKSLAWGLVKKVAGEAGSEAVAQLAGPIGWLKKLGDIFQKVAGGISWVCEEVMKAISRATFKPLGGN